ncbi:hypothetical protein [Chryseobacterium sp. Mn2064]|uniref:hypothetical protein n=1 Tax=Chryseobacterium sp. Mn2064 TaxID=3395263 RepID=UPI003BCFCD9D
MKKLAYILLILGLFHINIHAQQPSRPYTITYIVNKIIDKGEYVDEKRVDKSDKISTNHLIYISSPKKDSVAFYKFTDSQILAKKSPQICTLARSQSNLILKYEHGSYTTQLKLNFNDKEKSISVGDKDIFYLNDSYYIYLHKSIGDLLNIPDLIDFLEDYLTVYDLEDLKYILSYEKYKYNDFKILKAVMESYRTQATDYLDKWNVKFVYDKSGILKYVLKESTEGDKEMEKKLTFSNKGIFKYTKHTNVESRLVTDNEILIDSNKHIYEEKVSSFQVGLGKETQYEIKQVSFKSFPTKVFMLTSDNISKIKSSK